MTALLTYPIIIFTVLDDEDTTITAGSIVTVTISLVRENMSMLFPENSTERTDFKPKQHVKSAAVEELRPSIVEKVIKFNFLRYYLAESFVFKTLY